MNISKALVMDQTKVQSIAKNLRTLLKIHEVSEVEIARALNTSVMTIRRIISGETGDPRIFTLKLIADYFNVSIDSLLDDNQQRSINVMAKNKPQFIPILDWKTIEANASISDIDFCKWKEWYPIISEDNHINEVTFALESRPSMQPRFPHGTLFIINPSEAPIDGDIILIKMKQEKELSLRELIIDSPKWQLQPIVVGSETLFFDEKKHDIIGVVVLTLLHTRK